MRIGVSAFWFNRGQAVVARQLRSGLDSLGHETVVLARPTRGGNIKPAFIDHSDVWDQPGVTEASDYQIPASELDAWAADNALEAAFFDQNYQFEEIARLRAAGVKTIGRFVWEQFEAEHVAGALEAFDVVYSMTECEQERYRRWESRVLGFVGGYILSCSLRGQTPKGRCQGPMSLTSRGQTPGMWAARSPFSSPVGS